MTDEEFHAHFSQLSPIQRDVYLAMLPELYPGGVKEAAKAADRVWGSMAQPEEEAQVINPFLRGLVCASDIPIGDPPPSLWFGLYRSSVVLFVGETGAGKSSLLYNVAIHAARHEPLFNIPFGGNLPLRVLYIDPENAGNWAEGQGGNCRAKLNRIGAGTPKELYFHDGDGINLSDPATCDELERLILAQRFDIVIIDPIANLFRTKNEDANSEAAEHFTRLKAMSRKTGACIVAVHHTGKGTLNDYGRGASARLASADVGIMFRFKGDDEERDDTYTGELRPRTDICRLQITKNRLEGEGSLYLRMAGDDRFIVGSFEDWNNTKGTEGRQDKSESAEPYITQYLQDGEGHSRDEIQQKVQERGIGKHSIDAGIMALKERGKIVREVLARNKHVYRLVTPTSVATTEQGERAQKSVDSFFGDNGTEDAEPPVMERMRF